MSQEIELTTEFKKQTTKAIIAIALFVLTYLIILAGAVGLTILCIYWGLNVILLYPTILTIILGIGIMSLGVLILAFLLKFIMQSSKTDRSHLTEIKREEEPELFAMIHEIVDRVGTKPPKKVYLSADVNAAVFYDSNFWSMILPIRKNLQIGLGLVNTVTQSELKAILSHEFGHFSQKSMKVGSYVYNVNQVIFGIINDEGSYRRFVEGLASISGLVTVFVMLAVWIVNALRWILGKMYELVNKSYMGLSREMEFHADEIAANVTGYEPLKTSLLRMPMADMAFNLVVGQYNEWIADSIRSKNIFPEQTYVMNHVANQNKLTFANELPVVTIEAGNRFNKSKLVIDNQWASHPSTEDRIARLEKTGLNTRNENDISANSIFQNIIVTQEQITNKLFNEVKYAKTPQVYSFEEFQEDHKNRFQKAFISEVFNGYYEDKYPVKFDMPAWTAEFAKIKLEDLFSDEKREKIYQVISMESDKEIVSQISAKQIPIKTFDYDGQKYKRRSAKKLNEKIQEELEQLEVDLKENDLNIYKYFLNKEKENRDFFFLESKYKVFFQFCDEMESKFEIPKKLHQELDFINQNAEIAEIRAKFTRVEGAEKKLREGIEAMLSNEEHKVEMATATRENFEQYVSRKWVYISSTGYNEESLGMLFAAINDYAHELSKELFYKKKELLQYQVDLI